MWIRTRDDERGCGDVGDERGRGKGDRGFESLQRGDGMGDQEHPLRTLGDLPRCSAVSACAAGAIVVEPESVTFRDFDGFQPHQVRKKRAVWARLAGMKAAGMSVPETYHLRLDECARLNSVAENLAEARGARRRAKQGRLGEPPAVKRP